jgi:hypothetical protein
MTSQAGMLTKAIKRISNFGNQSDLTPSLFNPMLVARTVLLDGSVSGLRSIDSLGSILRVTAAPYSQLDAMRDIIRCPYIAYVIDTPLVYAGYGRANRNIGDRIEEQLQPATQVYIIYANDCRFAKNEASYIEARLIETAVELGVPLANRVRPFGRDGLAVSPDYEQLVAHARILLSVAGFARFEDARWSQGDPSTRFPANGNLSDVQVLDPETMTIPADAARMRLMYPDFRAEGYPFGDRFHLLPGADYAYADKSGLSEDNCQRRRAIEAMNILEPLPGIPGRARLLVGLDCRSPAIAGKIVSGAHIGNKVWQAEPELHLGAPS